MEAYLPVEGASETEKNAAYQALDGAIATARNQGKLVVIASDTNSHIRGLGHEETNDMGRRTLELCRAWDLEIVSVSEPTFEHSSGVTSRLDFFIMDRFITHSEFEISCEHALDDISDHHAILLDFAVNDSLKEKREQCDFRLDLLREPKYLKTFQDQL